MTYTKHDTDGFTLSDIVNGYYFKQRYIGYTKRDATHDFARLVRALKARAK